MINRRPLDAHRGFTLIELLAVMSVLTVLMGVGVGFMLRRGSPMEQTVAIVRDQVRLAAVSAKSRSAPTEVLLVLQDGRPQLMVRGLEPVAAWHCEPREQPLHEQVRGDVRGLYEPGRFGMAMRPDPDARTAILRVPTHGRPMWDLRNGFLLRLELRLDERSACTLVQLGRAFTLSLDGDGAPEVKLALAGAPGQQGAARNIHSTAPLPLRRWVTLDVVHDGSELQLVVDGRVAAQIDARGGPFQRDGDVFEVSPANALVPGLVDEIQLWAYDLAPPVDLPMGAEVTGFEGGLRFLPTGEPESVRELTVKTGDQTERHRVAPGGVLQ